MSPRRVPRAARTTTERGLGWAHQQAREALVAKHVDGSPCQLCGLPMYLSPALNPDGLGLDADHTNPRSLGGQLPDRLTHASCNRSRGNGSKDQNVKLHTITSRDWIGEAK